MKSIECEMQNMKLVTSLLAPFIVKEELVQVHSSCVDVKEELDEDMNEEVQVHSSCVDVKEELDEDMNEEFGDDPLAISCSTDYINEEPEVILEVDESETIVVTSPRYDSDSTRFIKHSSENCGISFEEHVDQGVLHEKLQKDRRKSTHASMCSTRVHELTSKEDTLFGTRLKCSLREKEFHKFSCCVCLQSFSSKYRLIMHVFIHIDGVQPPQYVCKSCGDVFPNNSSLSIHLTTNEDDYSSSPRNNEYFDSYGDCKNISLEDDKELPLMELNTKQSPSKENWKFSKKCFNGENNTHNIVHNAENLDKQDHYLTLSKTDNIDDKAFQRLSKRLHQCDVCGKSFTRLNHLKNHDLLHVGMKPHNCDTCGQSFALLSNLKSHALIHTEMRRHKCEICGKSFTHPSALKRHMFMHTGQKPYKCDVCDKKFARMCHLQAHSFIHSGQRAHKCDVCGKSFTGAGTLRKHALLHTGVRSHKCDVCGRSFTVVGDLNRHALTHIVKRPNTCDVCGESFAQFDDLKSHALIHIESRPYICDICGKGFAQLGALKRHAFRHTGMRSHKCDICGRSFTEFDTLKRHTYIHTEVKPHRCDICGKYFIQLSNLRRHSFLHTGTKPYKCDICDKSFIDTSTLKRHSLIHSRVMPNM